jgi:hypothetical protein
LIAKIAIASALKPVIDPRAYEKFGASLIHTGRYEVHILGSLPTTKEVFPPITLHPISANSKGSLSRLLVPWKILARLKKIKPDLLIINTHELLFIGVIFKLFTGKKLVYDIRENYYFNLLFQKNYPWGLRHLLAFYVRAKEILLSNFVDHFFLAEQCYVDEISFIKQQYSIIENKYLPPQNVLKKQHQLQTEFLISGTISKEYGVFEALRFFNQLPAAKYKLIIVGHCPNKQTFSDLKKEVNGIENIEFLVSATPIPHKDILAHIGNKTIALLPYQVNKSTENKIPTKLYEYIGMAIPLLVSPNPIWDKIIKKHHAGLSIDFYSPVNYANISRSLALINNRQSSDLKDVMWINEESKLLIIIDGLIS